jgi:hypothetical protein
MAGGSNVRDPEVILSDAYRSSDLILVDTVKSLVNEERI